MEDTKSAYNVKTPIFEGPFDVLLDLIERRKLFINEISLAQVTDDYVSYVKGLNMADDETAENKNSTNLLSGITSFIIIAATLILIKSKSILPNMLLTEDEEKEIGTLENRLHLYKVARDAGEYIKKIFGKSVIFSPLERKNDDVRFSPDPQITALYMRELADDVFRNIPRKNEPLPQVEVRKVISLEEMIDNLGKRIEESLTMNFREFSGHKGVKTKEEKVFVIVSFLAMLELVRQGIADVIQSANFDEIEMKRLEKSMEEFMDDREANEAVE